MNLREELKNHSLQYTKQREDLLRVLKSSDIPLTIEQIIDNLTIDMDLSTIYRILDAFESVGLVNKTVPLEPLRTVYDYNRDIHKHHVTCLKCGLIQVIESCPLGDYEQKVELSTGFTIIKHHLELYGLCPECQKKV